MLVLVRNPFGAGAGLVGLLAFLALLLTTLGDAAGAGRDRNRTVREARATSATLIASEGSGFVVETMSAPDADGARPAGELPAGPLAQLDGSSRILPVVRRPCMSSCA
jgi:hypothetical protein